MSPIAADKHFFDTLIEATVQELDRILVDDFILIDVVSGSEITKPNFLAAVESGQIAFEAIDLAENRIRVYGQTAIITGRTQMKGQLRGVPFSASSRYTHVFIERRGEWRLASAQGTPIAVPL